jgi:uncharacterized membrane protein (UPF0127 family)
MKPARHASLDGWTLCGPSGIVADRLCEAAGMGRIRGLLGRSEFGETEALIIRRCSQVHTFGVRFSIDAVFCDADLRVLRVAELRPARISPFVRRSRCCIELAGGRACAAGVVAGARLELQPPST